MPNTENKASVTNNWSELIKLNSQSTFRIHDSKRVREVVLPLQALNTTWHRQSSLFLCFSQPGGGRGGGSGGGWGDLTTTAGLVVSLFDNSRCRFG